MSLIPKIITSIGNIFLHLGAYTPMTVDGNIVVNGVLASCYAFSDHDLAHIAMTPVQWFPNIINWVFAVDDESIGYVKIAEDLRRWMLLSD